MGIGLRVLEYTSRYTVEIFLIFNVLKWDNMSKFSITIVKYGEWIPVKTVFL